MKRQTQDRPKRGQLKVEFESCPVQASLGTLGRKWALLVLRNIGLYHAQRFNEMLKVTPGLTKRVLSMRLRELEHEGFIEITKTERNYKKWDLTEKGNDVLPILMAFVQFGSKWYAEQVFSDKKPRALKDVFDESYIQKIMRNMMVETPRRTYVAPRSRPVEIDAVASIAK
jgi:DNA-binding HxlR family transcriptional regulator